MEARVVDTMRSLGFTATQAKIYVSLLKRQPATGYELARAAEVPRSAIYNVLGQLEGLGLVNAVQERPTKYQALPPQRLFDLLQTRFSSSLDDLRGPLERLAATAPAPSIWTVQGYSGLLDHARGVVNQASESLVASLWGREAKQLQAALRRAAERGVEVSLFSFTPLPKLPAHCYSYDIPEAELERYWPHKLVLIADRTRLLLGSAEEGDDNRAVATEEPALVEMAISNLVLDLTLYGQRAGVDTTGVVSGLTSHLAPIDQLAAAAIGKRDGGSRSKPR